MIILPGEEIASPTLGFFDRLAKQTEFITGHPYALMTAFFAILCWAAVGPIFDFSDSWQLVINTTTTIVTFLMVFLIQGNQTRASVAAQVKLDELIRSTHGAHNALVTLENLTLEEIEQFRAHYERLACAARERLRRGGSDTDTPSVVIAQ